MRMSWWPARLGPVHQLCVVTMAEREYDEYAQSDEEEEESDPVRIIAMTGSLPLASCLGAACTIAEEQHASIYAASGRTCAW